MESWITIAATLAAAFFGAWFAFLLDSRKKRLAEQADRVRNGNLALYNLYEYWNALYQYQSEVIAPFRDRNDAWLNMPPSSETYSRAPSLLNLDLSFILGTPFSGVYADVYLEEHRFHSAVALIKSRNDLILNQVRPAMNKAGATVETNYDQDFIENAIGSHIVAVLKVMSQGIVENVEEDISSLKSTYSTLRGVLVEMFPMQSFIQLDFDAD